MNLLEYKEIFIEILKAAIVAIAAILLYILYTKVNKLMIL